MTISHHPSELLLLSCAAGQLSDAETLVVRAHTDQCPQCTAMMRTLRRDGGELLDALLPAPMREDAHARAMAAIERAALVESLTPPKGGDAEVRRLAPVLRHVDMGRWRFAGFGVQWCPLETDESSGTRAFLLKVRAGTHLPTHTHSGTELTTVLCGSFTDHGETIARGDFDAGDHETEHSPVVGSDSDCICLVAIQGQLRLSGAFGRLLQPLVRF